MKENYPLLSAYKEYEDIITLEYNLRDLINTKSFPLGKTFENIVKEINYIIDDDNVEEKGVVIKKFLENLGSELRRDYNISLNEFDIAFILGDINILEHLLEYYKYSSEESTNEELNIRSADFALILGHEDIISSDNVKFASYSIILAGEYLDDKLFEIFYNKFDLSSLFVQEVYKICLKYGLANTLIKLCNMVDKEERKDLWNCAEDCINKGQIHNVFFDSQTEDVNKINIDLIGYTFADIEPNNFIPEYKNNLVFSKKFSSIKNLVEDAFLNQVLNSAGI